MTERESGKRWGFAACPARLQWIQHTGQCGEGLATGLVSMISLGDASFSAVHFFVRELSPQQDAGRKGEQGESV